MLKKVFVIGLPLIIILIFVYYLLGGFNEVNIQKTDTSSYIIMGRLYEGEYKADTLKNTFREMQRYVEKYQGIGTVSVISYNPEQESKDSLKQLIGIKLSSKPAQLIEKTNIDTLEARQAVRAIIKAHPIVMPSPIDVAQEIRAYAKREGLTLQKYAIEQYISEREIWVDIPVAIAAQ